MRTELYPRAQRPPGFEHGLLPGLLYSGLSLVTGGWWLSDPMPAHAGYDAHAEARRTTTATRTPSPRSAASMPSKIDRQLTFDQLTNVHYSGTRHAEDQPSHLIVHDRHLPTRCRDGVRQPVHPLLPGATSTRWWTTATGRKRLQINASNCVHCKTCDIMDPYQIIDWVPPEGGGGPAVPTACDRGLGVAHLAASSALQAARSRRRATPLDRERSAAR